MAAEAKAGGTGETRSPRAYSVEVPRGSLLLLLGTWALMAEGAIGLVFLPILIFTTDVAIPPGDIAAFGGLSLACVVTGGLMSTHWRGAWWAALATAVATLAWNVSDKGLTSWTEVYVAAAFTTMVVILFLLGYRAAGKPEAMAIVSARVPFRLKLAGVWASIFLILAIFLVLIDLDVAWMKDNAGYIARGVMFTILLAAGAIVLAVILALFGALGRLSKNPVAYGVSGFYTSFFRGTPLIVQLFLIYNALPQIGTNLGRSSLLNILSLTTFQAGIIGLGLNYGAYMTEIFRAGIQSVGHGQGEAAEALGMRYMQKMRRVVLPQATRVIIPPTGNEFIAMMKDTALIGLLGGVIGQAETFKRVQLTGNQDLRRLEALIIGAAVYWALTAVFTFFQSRLERRMSKGYVRTEAKQITGQKRFQFIPGHAGGVGGGGGGVVVTGEGEDTETEGML